jgi:hypothetical protein
VILFGLIGRQFAFLGISFQSFEVIVTLDSVVSNRDSYGTYSLGSDCSGGFTGFFFLKNPICIRFARMMFRRVNWDGRANFICDASHSGCDSQSLSII